MAKLMDSPILVQFIAVVLFAACVWHSWNVEGRRAAQQWFFIGYIFSLLLVSLLVVISQISFSESFLLFGAAPSLVVMLFPALYYLAYQAAQLFTQATRLRAMAYVIFLITPALMLPLDVTAVQFHWWAYPTESLDFLNGVPFYVPFAWGAVAAAFFLMIGRIRKIRFRGAGQFFAMIIAAPFVAGLMILVIALIQVLFDALGALGEPALYAALALLYIVLPLALVFNLPRLQSNAPAKK
jgi:hypothetical protein